MSRYKKIDEGQWNKFKSGFAAADTFFVEADNFIGNLISFGTGDDGQGEPIKMNPCHAGDYRGDGIGRTIEADGKTVALHLIDEYKKDVMAGNTRLVYFGVKNLSIAQYELIKKAWNELIGEKYNKWELFWYGIWGVFNKFTPFGKILSGIKNPAYKKDMPVCSQAAALKFKYVPELYNPLVADKDIDNMTPEELFDRILRICYFKGDSASLP